MASILRVLFKNPFRSKDNEENSRNGSALYGDCIRASPFTPDITEEVFSVNFKLPNGPFYDGKGDPEDHSHAFLSAFRLYGIYDAVICEVFPSFLQGNA